MWIHSAMCEQIHGLADSEHTHVDKSYTQCFIFWDITSMVEYLASAHKAGWWRRVRSFFKVFTFGISDRNSRKCMARSYIRCESNNNFYHHRIALLHIDLCQCFVVQTPYVSTYLLARESRAVLAWEILPKREKIAICLPFKISKITYQRINDQYLSKWLVLLGCVRNVSRIFCCSEAGNLYLQGFWLIKSKFLNIFFLHWKT
jgi:hypothetical protein